MIKTLVSESLTVRAEETLVKNLARVARVSTNPNESEIDTPHPAVPLRLRDKASTNDWKNLAYSDEV